MMFTNSCFFFSFVKYYVNMQQLLWSYGWFFIFFFKCIFYRLPHCCRQPEFPPLDESGRGRRMPWSLLCSSGEQVRSGLLAFLQLDVLPGTVNKANNWLRANAIVHFVSLWTLSCAIAADILQARWADIMATIYGKICANTSWQNIDII